MTCLCQGSINSATTWPFSVDLGAARRTIAGMSRSSAPEPADCSGPLGDVCCRWWTATDDDGEPVLGWASCPDGGRCAEWPPCPDGNPQRLCHALGFRERNVGELELRVLLGGDDGGVCQIVVDERDDEVYVRVFVCRDVADERSRSAPRKVLDCPVRVWLERPLGERAVIDVDTDEELPLFTPAYLNNVPQPDHGYRPANRRRPTG